MVESGCDSNGPIIVELQTTGYLSAAHVTQMCLIESHAIMPVDSNINNISRAPMALNSTTSAPVISVSRMLGLSIIKVMVYGCVVALLDKNEYAKQYILLVESWTIVMNPNRATAVIYRGLRPIQTTYLVFG